MNVKQNHLFKAAVCGLFIACALSWLAAAGPAEQLPENILRLHILANSDSEADQALKLKVRDAVLTEAARWCRGAGSLYEANAAVCTHLEGIAQAAGDVVYSRFLKQKLREPFHELCEDCGCEEKGVLRSALGHTVKIFLFLLAVNIALGCAIELVGEENISRLLLHGSVFQPLLSGLIGFIPNCAASVILTELYLEGSLSFGAAVAGLCTGAGLGLLVLFRVNKNWRENLCIAGVLYVAAVVTGTLCQIVMP